MTNIDKIKEEYEELIYQNFIDPRLTNKVWDFIQKKLEDQESQLLDRMEKEIEGMKKRGEVALGWGQLTPQEWDYNSTLNQVLDIIKKERKE